MSYKIAIIDDDLSNNITEDDLRRVDDENIIDTLQDTTSPEHQELLETLNGINLKYNNLSDLVTYINNGEISNSLPESIILLKKEAISKKQILIEPVNRIIKWLCECTELQISESDIDKFSCPSEFMANQNSHSYSLILVDYLLVNDSEEKTVPFIKEVKDNIEKYGGSSSFILMSSYKDKIYHDFSDIKSKLKMTSSRFRIMEKPSIDADKNEDIWKATFRQIFEQKVFVQLIETYIKKWLGNFENAFENLSETLWSLDAHSLDVIRRTAKEDNQTFSDYFTEVLFKKITAEFENSLKNSDECVRFQGESLETILTNANNVSPGNEVRSSRDLLKSLLKDISWHEDNWFYNINKYPVPDEKNHSYPAIHLSQFNWVKSNLRFGTVLQNKLSKDLLINLTQPCDIAHIDITSIGNIHLLFMNGKATHMSNSDANNSNKFALSLAIKLEDRWLNIQWDLSRPLTPSILDFTYLIEKYDVVAQLRSEQAQYVINRYVSKISRVATIRTPQLFDVKFVLLSLDKKGDVNINASGEGHAIKNKEIIVNFSPEQAIKIDQLMNSQTFSVYNELIKGITIPNNKNKSLNLASKTGSDNIFFLMNCHDKKNAEKAITEKKSSLNKKDNYLFIYFGS